MRFALVQGQVAASAGFRWNQENPLRLLNRSGFSFLVAANSFGRNRHAVNPCRASRTRGGKPPSQSPLNAFLTLAGIETLPLRMERHCTNALAVAEWLERHPKVAWVSHAGLPSSPFHALAQRYLPGGAGAVFTFGLTGGYEAGIKVVESVLLFSLLANIGDCRSLIIHPASTTHRQLTEEQRIAAGAGPDVVRLSIGIESVEDIIADLDQALRQSNQPARKAAE